MSFAFVGATTSSTASGVTSVTLAVPSGVANGDLMVLSAVTYLGSSQSITAPSGWTVIYNGILGSSMYGLVAYRVASSEPASYTVTFSASAWPSAVLYAVSGGTGVGQAVAAYPGATSTTLAAPTWTSTPASTSLLVYGYGGVNSAASGGGGLTLPSESTLLSGSQTADVNNTSGGTDYALLACQAASPGSATITTAVYPLTVAVEYTAPSNLTIVAPETSALADSAIPVIGVNDFYGMP